MGQIAASSPSPPAFRASDNSDSASSRFDVSSQVSTTVPSDSPTVIGGAHASLTIHQIGSELDPGAVAAAFDQTIDLEWWLPSRASRTSAEYTKLFSLADDLLDAF